MKLFSSTISLLKETEEKISAQIILREEEIKAAEAERISFSKLAERNERMISNLENLLK